MIREYFLRKCRFFVLKYTGALGETSAATLDSELGTGRQRNIMDLASLLEIIAGVAVTVIAGGWLLLREISAQLRALRQELEEKMDSKIQQLEDRMDGRMQKLEDGQKKLEDGQIALGRQIARLEGLFDGLRQPLPEEPRTA